METNQSLHEKVAAELIKQLKSGTAPWQKPWNTDGMPTFQLPYNAQTGNRYRGINAMQLLLSGWQDPRWLTFKQAESMEAKINRGEKGTLIQFVKTHQQRALRDEKGKVILDELGAVVNERILLSRPIVSTAWVFNAQQISGLQSLVVEKTPSVNWDPVSRAESLIKASGAEINHRYMDSAYYDVRYDTITLPERSQFTAADHYYATALHELAHWTGHPSRLDRVSLLNSGMIAYSKEELRAEIASMIIGAELGIGHDPGQHVAYVESWVSILKDTPFEIHAAAADAEKIFDFLIQIERSQQVDHSRADGVEMSEPRKLDYLSTGDQISYKDAVYKVEGHLKQGRLRMEQIPTGLKFTLSPADPLYHSLCVQKEMQQSLSHGIMPVKQNPDQINLSTIKR